MSNQIIDPNLVENDISLTEYVSVMFDYALSSPWSAVSLGVLILAAILFIVAIAKRKSSWFILGPIGVVIALVASTVLAATTTTMATDDENKRGERIITDAINEKYDIPELDTGTYCDDCEDNTLSNNISSALTPTISDSPFVRVQLDDDVVADYLVEFDNESGEATLYAESNNIPEPKELLRDGQ